VEWIHIEESNEHCLYLWFWCVSLLGLWGCQLFSVQPSSLAFGIITCLISFRISH
jgi:lipid-A-disaccharide synthase-like uncharacterized protein